MFVVDILELAEVFLQILRISSVPLLHVYSNIVWGTDYGLVSGRISTETYSHPNQVQTVLNWFHKCNIRFI